MAFGARRSRGVALVLAAVWALVAGGAHGHVVYGTSTLRLLTLESDAVVRVRIVDPSSEVVAEEYGMREAVVVAQVLEGIKGPLAEGPLRFAQHGHGVPQYDAGEEVVLFLQRIERNREIGASPLADRVEWISVQEAGAKYGLDDANRADFVAAVRAYAELERQPPDQQLAGLRRVTVELLGSRDPRIASSAVRDLVFSRDVAIVTAEDVPRLTGLLNSKATPVGVRVALLTELDRRGLVEGAPWWAALLRQTGGRDRMAVVRATASHPSEPVHRELTKLLSHDDPLLVAAAAVSLGAPGNAAAVAALEPLLDSGEERVRMAAIRGLGGVGTPGARAALSQTADGHADPATRRRAAAELTALAKRSRPSSPTARSDASGAPSRTAGSP